MKKRTKTVSKFLSQFLYKGLVETGVKNVIKRFKFELNEGKNEYRGIAIPQKILSDRNGYFSHLSHTGKRYSAVLPPEEEIIQREISKMPKDMRQLPVIDSLAAAEKKLKTRKSGVGKPIPNSKSKFK